MGAGASKWRYRNSSMNSDHSVGPPSTQGLSRVRRALSTRAYGADPNPAHVGQQGRQSDGCFGQAVDGLLLVAGMVATGYQSGLLQALQPVGQNVEAIPSSDRVSNSRK
jgi:hypothetical protein